MSAAAAEAAKRAVIGRGLGPSGLQSEKKKTTGVKNIQNDGHYHHRLRQLAKEQQAHLHLLHLVPREALAEHHPPAVRAAAPVLHLSHRA